MSTFGLRLRSAEGFVRFDGFTQNVPRVVRAGSYVNSMAPFEVPGLGAKLAAGRAHVWWASEDYAIVSPSAPANPVYQTHVVGDMVYPPTFNYQTPMTNSFLIIWW